MTKESLAKSFNMELKINWLLIFVGLATAGILSACCPAIPESKIPDITAGRFNVAMVFSNTHEDGRWSESHYEGLQHLDSMAGVSAQYIENVPEFCDSSSVFRQLSRKGFNLIIGTAFGYADSMAAAAQEFPEVAYIQLSGFKPNPLNLAPMYGAMEEMMYLAGMLAGGRAKADENPKLGFLATMPVPDQFRMINAAALGIRRTCEECEMEVRWLRAWVDEKREKILVEELFDQGAQVVFSGAETPVVVEVAANQGKWAVAFGRTKYCQSEACLTAPYWNWGPIYAQILGRVQAKSFRPAPIYFHTNGGGLGLYGMMPGEPPTKGLQGLPEEIIGDVLQLLERLRLGEKDAQLAVFAGEILDNRGNVIVKEGEFLEQEALDQFPPGAPNEKCDPYCMYWFAQGITTELPDIGR